ncbi:hypothetical protein QT381_11595 [Galbitalea sp. SE-J8]|uniref:hypothetical protein n=1 Tax=Galbitalea sp. SE-J8 TaxID=3054952 RepID=UPI00259CB584|nr:hypothetical protein [Galbitalea sp. SE-J8]MDM4763652.1 hypothetical protein [Galbitalea sp. SE-J8]
MTPHGRRGLSAWAVVLLAVAASAVAFLRLDPLARDTVWAEDGRYFLGGALDGAGALEPYQGYLQFVPRVLAGLITSLVPIDGWAIALTVASSLVAGAVAAAVLVVTRSLPFACGTRIALAALTVLTPGVATEVLGNVANAHWLLLWLAPWLLLFRPRSWAGSATAAALALVATLTEIQIVVFAPLLLVHARERRHWPIIGATVLGLGAQFATTLLAPRAIAGGGRPGILSIALGYALHVGGSAWHAPGEDLIRLVAERGWWVALLPLVPFAIAVAVLVVRSRSTRWLALALATASVMLFSAGFELNAGPDLDYAALPANVLAEAHALRYGVVPAMLLLAVLLIAADRGLAFARRGADAGGTGPRARRTAARLVAGAGFAIVVVGVLTAVATSVGATDSLRKSAGPSWSASLVSARAACADGAASVDVQTAPDKPEWRIALDCALLISPRS